ncbi:MAG TPA: DUF4112 domain-containing protein [Planctomycetales bacterium]|jgi:hypothetical protein|nr:DUF4112 domain-containing protein [Planctomycetales bacterium]
MSDYPIVPIPEPKKGEPLQGEVLFGPSPASPSPEPMLALLDLVSFVMDRLIEVPGTKVRVGLNTLLLLLPIVGDAFSSAVSAAILTIGLSVFRVPKIIAVRMMTNALIDASIGWIPVLGDVFNLWFKADTRNVRLLMEYAGQTDQGPPSTWKHWLFVVGAALLFLLVLTLIGVGVWSLIALAVRALQVRPSAAG